jgi:16S rRNA G966 N2-methylase RsmD
MGQGILFEVGQAPTTKKSLSTPQGYRGFAAFHKYWGKKPVECLSYLIEKLTHEQEVVLDPFLGSGLLARQAFQRNRRFIGIDINPVAIELSRLMVNPPDNKKFSSVLRQMEISVKPKVDESYRLADGNTATHFLWEGDEMLSVWCLNGRRRRESKPVRQDVDLFRQFSGYKTKFIRDLQFFTNSRINASPEMGIGDLFTGRALRNIDCILAFIREQPEDVRNALLMTLTAASGQMSQMVFAVSRRGKTKGKIDDRISVGSWVIGYWRPRLHFEINSWNCFWRKAMRLAKALDESHPEKRPDTAEDCLAVLESRADIALIKDDARRVLARLPERSISLILTDPPHSDRIPYLELSELWNAILNQEVLFEREIVVSNARERCKAKDTYAQEMEEFFLDASHVLSDGGTLAILFNASNSDSWGYLEALQRKSDSLRFRGCFPMVYSARSVVQDNRTGALKHDYVLIYEKFSKNRASENRWKKLSDIDGWSSSLPTKEE